MSNGYRSTTAYELHIFKDADISWKSAKTFVLPLSAESAQPFFRYKGRQDGLINLRRCSPEQLGFLTSYTKTKNAESKAERDAARARREAKEAARRAAQDEKNKKYREFQKIAETRRQKEEEEKAEQRRKEAEEGAEVGKGNTDTDSKEASHVPPDPPTFRRRGRRGAYRRGSPDYARVPPPPPPFPAMYHPTRIDVVPLPRDLQDEFNELYPPEIIPIMTEKYAVERSSDWVLEAVEIDVVPAITKITKETPNGNFIRYSSDDSCVKKQYPIISYALAETSKTEFAAVYSRRFYVTGNNEFTEGYNLRPNRRPNCRVIRSDVSGSEVGDFLISESDDVEMGAAPGGPLELEEEDLEFVLGREEVGEEENGGN